MNNKDYSQNILSREMNPWVVRTIEELSYNDIARNYTVVYLIQKIVSYQHVFGSQINLGNLKIQLSQLFAGRWIQESLITKITSMLTELSKQNNSLGVQEIVFNIVYHFPLFDTDKKINNMLIGRVSKNLHTIYGKLDQLGDFNSNMTYPWLSKITQGISSSSFYVDKYNTTCIGLNLTKSQPKSKGKFSLGKIFTVFSSSSISQNYSELAWSFRWHMIYELRKTLMEQMLNQMLNQQQPLARDQLCSNILAGLQSYLQNQHTLFLREVDRVFSSLTLDEAGQKLKGLVTVSASLFSFAKQELMLSQNKQKSGSKTKVSDCRGPKEKKSTESQFLVIESQLRADLMHLRKILQFVSDGYVDFCQDIESKLKTILSSTGYQNFSIDDNKLFDIASSLDCIIKANAETTRGEEYAVLYQDFLDKCIKSFSIYVLSSELSRPEQKEFREPEQKEFREPVYRRLVRKLVADHFLSRPDIHQLLCKFLNRTTKEIKKRKEEQQSKIDGIKRKRFALLIVKYCAVILLLSTIAVGVVYYFEVIKEAIISNNFRILAYPVAQAILVILAILLILFIGKYTHFYYSNKLRAPEHKFEQFEAALCAVSIGSNPDILFSKQPDKHDKATNEKKYSDESNPVMDV